MVLRTWASCLGKGTRAKWLHYAHGLCAPVKVYKASKCASVKFGFGRVLAPSCGWNLGRTRCGFTPSYVPGWNLVGRIVAPTWLKVHGKFSLDVLWLHSSVEIHTKMVDAFWLHPVENHGTKMDGRKLAPPRISLCWSRTQFCRPTCIHTVHNFACYNHQGLACQKIKS